ncbi:hypothetical protein AB0G05_32635, partial [Nonomuraea wenchangensis]
MRRALIVLAVLAGQLLAGQGLLTAAAPPAAARTATGPQEAAPTGADARRQAPTGGTQRQALTGDGAQRVALIGVPALHWHDLDPADTPHLWALAGSSAIGSLSVRTVGNVTCPYDGWLTVSAGTRSAAGYGCGAPPAPEQRGEGAVIPDYRYLIDVAGNREAGNLGEALKAAGQCALAIGPGAALALADREGRIPRYHASPAQLAAGDLERCRLTVMDVDDLVSPYLTGDRLPATPEQLAPARRREAARLADAKAGALLAALPAGT